MVSIIIISISSPGKQIAGRIEPALEGKNIEKKFANLLTEPGGYARMIWSLALDSGLRLNKIQKMLLRVLGEMAEWLIAADLKSVESW